MMFYDDMILPSIAMLPKPTSALPCMNDKWLNQNLTLAEYHWKFRNCD